MINIADCKIQIIQIQVILYWQWHNAFKSTSTQTDVDTKILNLHKKRIFSALFKKRQLLVVFEIQCLNTLDVVNMEEQINSISSLSFHCMKNLMLTMKSHLHFQVNLFCLLCALTTQNYSKVTLSIAGTHGWWRAGAGVGGGFVLTLFSNPL